MMINELFRPSYDKGEILAPKPPIFSLRGQTGQNFLSKNVMRAIKLISVMR